MMCDNINHIAAPGGRYAGGNPVQQIFLHPQHWPLRHSCGEILVLVIIFDYIYCIWTKYTFTSMEAATAGEDSMQCIEAFLDQNFISLIEMESTCTFLVAVK